MIIFDRNIDVYVLFSRLIRYPYAKTTSCVLHRQIEHSFVLVIIQLCLATHVHRKIYTTLIWASEI